MTHSMSLMAAERPSPQLVYNREYACHQAVMAATGGQKALWVDLAGETKAPLLRVLSPSRINIPSGWKLCNKTEYAVETVESGELVAFRLRCNPVVRRDGKRFPVWSNKSGPSRESLVEEWLRRRGDSNGFKLHSATVLDVGVVKLRRTGQPKSAEPVIFATATITGHLEVANAVSFRRMLIDGIGPQKAFGCGLMLIKRRRNDHE